MSAIQIVSHTSVPSESVARLMDALGSKEEPNTLHYGKGVDKITQYTFFKEHDLPHIPWSTDLAVARKWQQEGGTIMCRARIKGQTGTGIVVATPVDELVAAKVYTLYVSHKREFRVNVLRGKVVNIREKLRMADTTGDFHIRNQENGYTTAHCRPLSNIMRANMYALAESASAVSDSDIVGVDIGLNEAKEYPFLIEVNSGPTIEGSTLREMTVAIKALFKQGEV